MSESSKIPTEPDQNPTSTSPELTGSADEPIEIVNWEDVPTNYPVEHQHIEQLKQLKREGLAVSEYQIKYAALDLAVRYWETDRSIQETIEVARKFEEYLREL